MAQTPPSNSSKPADEGLDLRRRQITEGAGLEESRLNQDFVEFLKKWSTPLLLVVVAAVGSYVGLQKLREAREAKLAAAFAEYDRAVAQMSNGRDALPAVLLGIASDHEGQGAVPVMARLAAAEQYQVSAMKGMQPGAETDPVTGKAAKAEDILTPAQRLEFIENARVQYQWVLDKTKGDKGKALQTLSAYFGLASVAETTGKFDEAKQNYEAAKALASEQAFDGVAALATKRIESLDGLKSAPPLLPDSMVMSYERPPEVPKTPAPGSAVPGLNLNTGNAMTGTEVPLMMQPPPPTVIPPSPAPTTAPAPAPAPTPAPAPAPASKPEDKPKQ